MSMKAKSSVLSIDWGKKYIGSAYALEGSSVVFPIGYLVNDKTVFGEINDIITRYRVKRIIVGIPRDPWARTQIEQFANVLSERAPTAIEIDFFDEDYTSVQAGEKIGNFEKNVAEDTLAAMVILERWIEENKANTVSLLTPPEDSSS